MFSQQQKARIPKEGSLPFVSCVSIHRAQGGGLWECSLKKGVTHNMHSVYLL